MKFFIFLFFLTSTLVACSSNDTSGGATKTDLVQSDTIQTKKIDKSWLGKWERQQWQNDATLEITSIKNGSIEFSLFASSGGQTGEVAGVAIINDNIAIFSNKDESDTCLIQFKLIGDSIIAIDQKQGLCFAAMAVTYNGDYKNSKNLTRSESLENLANLGIFKTEKEDSVFKALVGDSYSLFVNSTQLTSEDEDLDNLNASVRSSGISGLFTFMENIIMTDSSNSIWAAVIDDNRIYYFTNRKEYKEKLPKTIDNWRQRFRDYPIIYK